MQNANEFSKKVTNSFGGKKRIFPDRTDGTGEELLVLVPGVVFDRFGNRYGYGKGYYDRYFARFPFLKRIALAYSEQLADEPLECLETDVKMQVIATEHDVIIVE